MGQNTLNDIGYLAGSDPERLDDLITALVDPKISAVICSRGGYGALRLLDGIDWEMLGGIPPKPFIGFSDIGALQLVLLERSGWISYSSLQGAYGLGGNSSDRSIKNMRNWLEGNGGFEWEEGEDFRLTRESGTGEVSGTLLPICLSMLVSLLGTAYEPKVSNAILCIEDINEPPYKLDRMFWQLAHSGWGQTIKCLIAGEFIYQEKSLNRHAVELIKHYFAPLGCHIFSDLSYGHTDDRMTLPIGAVVKIDNEGAIHLA